MSSTSGCAGAVHASAAFVVLVDDVAAPVAVAVDVARGVALGAAPGVPAQPAIAVARIVATRSRIAHMIVEETCAWGKTSLKT